MRTFIAILLLSVSGVLASTNQESVKKHFSDVIEAQIRLMFEAQFEGHPKHPLIEQRKKEIDTVIAQTIPEAFKAFAPELDVTEDEATLLLQSEPNKEANLEKINKNKEEMSKSPLPKPVLVTTMFATYKKEADQSAWFFETLKRLTDGTVRQLRERGEIE